MTTKWVAYNEHDELKRAVQQIEELEQVVGAAVDYVHALESNDPQKKAALINLFATVAIYEADNE